MSTQVLRNASDTWVNEVAPAKNYGKGKKIQVDNNGGNEKNGLIFFSQPFPAGVTIISAKVYLYSGVAMTGTQVLKVKRVDAKWSVNRVNWNNQPAVGATIKSLSKSNPAVNAEWSINITELMQQVSDGSPWYGLQLIMDPTGGANPWFHSAQSLTAYRPRLEITWSDAPDAPEDLYPSGGRAVKTNKPVLRCNFTDVSGDTSISAINVQIDAANDFTAGIDFDSGWVTTSIPHLDLALTAYAGLANGASTYWRVRVKDGAGLISDWSQSAKFMRVDQAAPVWTSPQQYGSVDATNLVTAPAYRDTEALVDIVADAAGDLGVFTTALASVGTTPVNIFIGPGDSITEGAWLSDWRKAWIGQMVDQLSAKYGTTGNFGQVTDVYNAEGAANAPVASAGTPVANYTLGMGLQTIELNSSDDILTVTVPKDVTYIQVYYKRATDASLGQFYVDQGAGQFAVNTGSQGSSDEAAFGLALTFDPTYQNNVVKVGWYSGNKVQITGIGYFWGAITKGFRVIEGAQSGYKAQDFIANTAWSNALKSLQPKLVIMPIGSNDFYAGRTVAQCKADIEAIIDHLRTIITDANVPIVLLPWYDRPKGAAVDTWDAFRKMYYDIAQTKTKVTVYGYNFKDIGPWEGTDRGGKIWPTFPNSTFFDMVHPTEYGHSILANGMTKFLTGQHQRGNAVIKENLCTNPSFQVNTTGWAFAANDTQTITASGEGAPTKWRGTHYLKVVKTTATTGDASLIAKYAFTAPAAGWYRASIDVKAVTAIPSTLPNLDFVNYAGSTNETIKTAYPAGVFGTRQRISTEIFIAAGDLIGDIELRGVQPGATQEWHIDGMVIERGIPLVGEELAYFDGDSVDTVDRVHVWTGAPHASASTVYGKRPSRWQLFNVAGYGQFWRETIGKVRARLRQYDATASGFWNIGAYNMAVVAGTVYRVRAKWKLNFESTTDPRIAVLWYNATPTQIGTSLGTAHTTPFDGEDDFTVTAPAGAVWAAIMPGYSAGPGAWEGEFEYVSMIDNNASWTDGDYFDGSSTFDGHSYSWASTADLSASYARFGPAVREEEALLAWNFAGQVAYQVYILDPANVYKVLWDSGKVTSTQGYVTVPKGVITTEEAMYRAVLRVWDGQPREQTPNYPIYGEAVLDFKFTRGIDIDPVTNLALTNLSPYPFIALTWNYTGAAEKFEILRSEYPSGAWKLIDSGEPGDFLQADGSYKYTDTLSPLRVQQRWKVVPIVNGYAPLSSTTPTVTGTARLPAPMLSELDGTDPVFFLNPDRQMGKTGISQVYQTAGDSPPVVVTQESRKRRYSGTISGRLTADIIEGVSGIKMKERFERLSEGPGRTLRLTILNEQMKVFLVNPTWEPRVDNEGVWYQVSFGFYQVD